LHFTSSVKETLDILKSPAHRYGKGNFMVMKGILTALAVGLLFFLSCSSGARDEVPQKEDKCGECLNLPAAEVCTESGVMKNNCLAICRRVKIECSGPCPCPR